VAICRELYSEWQRKHQEIASGKHDIASPIKCGKKLDIFGKREPEGLDRNFTRQILTPVISACFSLHGFSYFHKQISSLSIVLTDPRHFGVFWSFPVKLREKPVISACFPVKIGSFPVTNKCPVPLGKKQEQIDVR
jgi:hypothetical protein